MKVIIAAAGTGGHINPGIAIANKIKKNNPNAHIIFIGTKRGLENDLVPRAGYELRTIEAYGIKRQISLQNFKNLCKTLKSYKVAKNIIKEIKPDIIIGTGGYICGPVISGGAKLGIPTMLHESNAFPGVAVKVLSKKTDTILVGFEDAVKRLPNAKNIVVTGTPTKVKKIDLTQEQKETLKRQFNIKNNLPIVVIFGGSQGAESINRCLIDIINKKQNEKYQIVWAVGQKNYESVRNAIKEENNASIVVPFPYATENHQEYNAKVLANANAAKIILDKDLNNNILNNTINEMIQDESKLKQMGQNAEKKSIKNVKEKIYHEIEKLINR